MPWLEDLKFPRGYQMGTHKRKKPLKNIGFSKGIVFMVPKIELEPTTYALRVRCTTNCANGAYKREAGILCNFIWKFH